MRWAASVSGSRLGALGWAFEIVDRQGRFHSFYCGASEARRDNEFSRRRYLWHEKHSSLPDLIKSMSGSIPERAAFDEVKVFEIEEPDPETALQVVQRISLDSAPVSDPLEEVREIVSRYGVRSLASPRGFSAPFLWYNTLPARSIPVRKLPLYLAEMHAVREKTTPTSIQDVEDQARTLASAVGGVCGIGDCIVARIRSEFLVTLQIHLDPDLTVARAHLISQGVEEAIRSANPKARFVIIQVLPAPSHNAVR